MPLSAQAWRVIRHPWVQRLAHITQLGFVGKVWPSTCYSRLSHSVGVALWAKKAFAHLRPQWSCSLPVKMGMWLELAGLLHDVGHGPFSHTFDHLMPSHFPKHEERGQLMIPRIFEQVPGLTEEDARVVQYLIHPRLEEPTPLDLPRWVTTLVSNPFHGLDVDRLEYLQSDSAILYELAQEGHIRMHPFRVLTHVDVDKMIGGMKLLESQEPPYWTYAEEDNDLFQHCDQLRTLLHFNLYRHPRVLEWEKTAIHYGHFALSPEHPVWEWREADFEMPTHAKFHARLAWVGPHLVDDIWLPPSTLFPHPPVNGWIHGVDWATTQRPRYLAFDFRDTRTL